LTLAWAGPQVSWWVYERH